MVGRGKEGRHKIMDWMMKVEYEKLKAEHREE